MNDKTKCPLCNTENISSNSKCFKCGYEFTRDTNNDSQPSDWLNELRSNSNDSDNQDSIQESFENNINEFENLDESPDWLTRIRDRKEVDDEYTKFSEQIIDQVEKDNDINKTTDIIGNLRNQTESDQKLNVESNNLISNLRGEGSENAFVSMDTTNPVDSNSNTHMSDNEEKDWFQRLIQVNNLNNESDPNDTIEEDEEKNEVPGWIQNSNVIQSLDNDPEIEINKEKTKEDVPDWVSKFDSFDNADEKPDDEPVLPDWVQSPEINTTDINLNEQDIDEEIPEWINLNKTKPSNIQEKIQEKPSSDEALFDHEDLIEIENSETDQTYYRDNESILPSSDEEISKKETESDGFELADISLSDLPLSPGKTKTSEKNILDTKKEKPKHETNPINLEAIPDWISEIDSKNDQIISPNLDNKEKQTYQDDTGISPGELPNWLKAMRPIEAVTPSIKLTDNRKKIEESGPLSGLKGVLSSEDVTTSYSSPPSYSVKLDLSEKQIINAKVLEQVFSSDQKPDADLVKVPQNREIITRLTITFVLLLVIILGLFSNFQEISFPDIFPSETVRFTTISNGLLLSQETPPHILIIMDNEAASQAEINLLIRPVFERLMLKNSYLSIISANPNGVLVASDILAKANYSISTFNSEERISNFGYLPGNTNGIQSFLSNPRISLPVGIYPKDIWNSPGLIDIQHISQFDSIILVSDNPESSKLWLEQIRIFIPDMPILVAATSQASPLLQPYVDSGQIDGMISGLYGSLTYSQLIQSESEILTPYWNMYKAGIYLFILIILFGGLMQLINKIFNKSFSKERH